MGGGVDAGEDPIIALIQQGKFKQLRTELKKNPQRLVESPLPLVTAIEQDQPECMRTVLELLTDPAIKPTLKPGGNGDVKFLRDDPLYAFDSATAEPAHIKANSPEQLLLLKEFGCDLSVCAPAFNAHRRFPHKNLLSQLLANYTYAEDIAATQLIEATIDEALASGLAPTPEGITGMRYSGALLDFANGLLLSIFGERKIKPAFEAEKLIFLGKRGFDLRSAMNPRSDYSDSVELITENIVAPFQALVRGAPAAYLAAAAHSLARKEAALTACAGGTLPALLDRIARRHDEAAFSECLSYTDEFWRQEYHHSLRIAQATLARTAPKPESALSNYARGGAA